ncbi:MAG TPA: aminoacyl-tRNA hydrolase, partial [Rhodobacteraceae bacterium]|nr:aminoacyl-tRNA hydrolase [Paracoccaceae bacterium]
GEAYARVRLGIGHPGHKDRVSPYVLSDFARADAGWLDDLLRGIVDGAPYLAAGDGAKFTNAVALRTAPPKPKPAAKPKPSDEVPTMQADEAAPMADEARSPLQKLVDKFR